MRWLLPKSLNGFLLLGLFTLAGPLLFGILNATVQMRRLAGTSQKLVVDSVQTTRLSQDMYAQIALLERSARLYLVLADQSVLYRSATTISASARSPGLCISSCGA